MNKINISNSIIKKLNNRYKGIQEITQKEWVDLEECECGGPLFKFHDTSVNVFVVKCGHVKETLEFETRTKKKLWFISKKQPCGFMCIAISEKPDYENYKKTDIPKEKFVVENFNKKIEERLRDLFNYYFLSKRDSVIQEINLLVKNKLYRKSRITYYLPTTELLLRESHKESIEDYQARIFSVPIVDKSVMKNITNTITNKMANIGINDIKKKINKSELILDNNSPSDDDSESKLNQSDNESELESKSSDNESELESESSDNESENKSNKSDQNSVTDFGDFGSDGDDDGYDNDFGDFD
jgi:cobalamin biosynthesis protein CobT